MADDFDAVSIGVQLDRAEQCGAIDTDTARVLRRLVRGRVGELARMATNTLIAVGRIPSGRPVELVRDIPIRTVRDMTDPAVDVVGRATRDIEPGELVWWDPETRGLG